MLNKHVLLLIAGAFIVFSLYGQKTRPATSFSIDGSINHFGTGMLVGAVTDPVSNAIILDTISVKNDVFKHTCKITVKQVIQYVTADDRFSKYRKVVKDGDSVVVDFADKRVKSFEIVAFPGASIKIAGEASAYMAAYPLGNADNEMIATLNKKRYPLLNEWGSLDYSDRKNIKITLHRDRALTDSIFDIENAFIKNNPTSLISAYLILEKFERLNKKNPEQADSLLSLLAPNSNNIYYQNMLLLQSNRLKELRLSVGDVFPNFQTRFVYQDTVFNLDQTKGKYRLLDFWGTWCIPCVREMPKLKQFYESHKDKLIVIGVANDTYQNWKAFLDKNDYTWIQLIDQEPIKLSEKLKVEVYPTKYLLDPDGKVVMLVKDSDEDVWNKIERLMNGK